MKKVSLIGKIKNVNFDFNAIYSSPTNANGDVNEDGNENDQLLNEKSCRRSSPSSSSSTSAAAASSTSTLKSSRSKRKFGSNKQQRQKHQQNKHRQEDKVEGKEEGIMPTQRRKVRNVEQRRKMKLHNRKDDIPDCDTLEIIEYDENAYDGSFVEPYPEFFSDLSNDESESKTSTPKKSKRNKSRLLLEDGEPLPMIDPLETRISLTDATANGADAKNNSNNDDDKSFKSCFSSSAASDHGSSTKYGDYNSTSPAMSTTSAGGRTTTSSRARSGKRRHRSGKHRRRRSSSSEKPSFLLTFAKTLMENLGQAITDFFMFLFSLLKADNSGSDGSGSSGNRMTPASCLLILVGTYFFISYIEVSFAGLVEIIFEWLWPSIHICLRMIERFFKGIGNAFAGLDDLAESSYCDMASMWCDFFNLMCSSRCSFTKFALERIRG